MYLLNSRHLFLSLFVTASVTLPNNENVRLQCLSMWLDVVSHLMESHKDHFTADSILSGLYSEAVNLVLLLIIS